MEDTAPVKHILEKFYHKHLNYEVTPMEVWDNCAVA